MVGGLRAYVFISVFSVGRFGVFRLCRCNSVRWVCGGLFASCFGGSVNAELCTTLDLHKWDDLSERAEEKLMLLDVGKVMLIKVSGYIHHLFPELTSSERIELQ